MGYNGIASFQRNLGAWIVLEKSPCFGGCKSLSTGFLVKSESLRIPGCPASSERWNRTQILHLSGHRRSGSAWGPEGWFIKKWHPFSISSVMFFLFLPSRVVDVHVAVCQGNIIIVMMEEVPWDEERSTAQSLNVMDGTINM